MRTFMRTFMRAFGGCHRRSAAGCAGPGAVLAAKLARASVKSKSE